MGTQLLEFITNHWPLCLALVGVLGLMVINENIIQKQGPKNLTPSAAVNAINHDAATVIDMRDANSFRDGHIVDAKNIPNAPLEKLKKYQKKPLILVCARGLQSSPLAVKLRKQDFENIMVLTGGIAAWKAANLPLAKGKKAQKNKKS